MCIRDSYHSVSYLKGNTSAILYAIDNATVKNLLITNAKVENTVSTASILASSSSNSVVSRVFSVESESISNGDASLIIGTSRNDTIQECGALGGKVYSTFEPEYSVGGVSGSISVSYTHLDVYKRQQLIW